MSYIFLILILPLLILIRIIIKNGKTQPGVAIIPMMNRINITTYLQLF